MQSQGNLLVKWVLIVALTILHRVNSICELSFTSRNSLLNFSLASPLPKFPHGVLSEDGFYTVAVNGTVLWFQLCDGMIFNHDPPRCVNCLDCGGPSRCGMTCSALVAENIGGYDVCTTIGYVSSTHIDILDERNPRKGVIVRMYSGGAKRNCSLSVSVICDSNVVKGPLLLEKSGTCNYATVLQHPAGCAKVISGHGSGWGWFGTFLIIILCLLGAYLVAGTVYRSFFLGIRGIEIIPNLDFWTSLPHNIQSFFASLWRRLRGPSHGYRASYSAVNF